MTTKFGGHLSFEKWQTVHRHFVNDKDELHGLWTILLAARFGYRNEVTNGVKTHQRFVEDFACSHKHVNCNKAGCKNVHRKITTLPSAF